MPLPDDTLMIEPPPPAIMSGMTARQHRNWLVRQVRRVHSQLSRLVLSRSEVAPG